MRGFDTVGLPALFIISLVSATLLPLGSEPAVFGLIKLNPDLFWAIRGGKGSFGGTRPGTVVRPAGPSRGHPRPDRGR